MAEYLPLFEELCRLTREAALVESVEALLGWDERTYMPEGGGEYRAEQMTFLSGSCARNGTNPPLGRTAGRAHGFAAC